MTWATFYMICFVVGLAFSFLLLLGGAGKLHLHVHFHVPHAGHAGAGHSAPGHAAGRGGAGQVSFLNFFSLVAFLAWFGGTGFLITEYSHLWFALGLLLATGSGLVGAAIVFWFLAKVLIAHETYLDPADFDLVGTIAHVSSGIREGGTGEVIFSQGGTRRVSGARSEDGKAIAKGIEVAITRYERGIAYVRRWDEMTQ
jgi:membrane protein implicated in regulation of membrane protease activity